MPLVQQCVRCTSSLEWSKPRAAVRFLTKLSDCPMGVTLLYSRRCQSTDQFHRYINNPHIVQPDGVDGILRTKGDQQQWLNTEQWDGYSDTYLKRFMQYPATAEHPNSAITPKHDQLYHCLQLVYDLYGTLADDLQELHDDPLHPNFHARIDRISAEREKIASALDAHYAPLHPTVKTVYDAFLVRRYYHLRDWIEYVREKRRVILEDLSPDYVDQVLKARTLSSSFIQRLKALETAFQHNPLLGLGSGSTTDDDLVAQYSTGELAVLRQKAAYFRKMRRFGANQMDADRHT